MKNKTFQSSASILFGLISLTFLITPAFADLSDCKNQTTVYLDKEEKIPMIFCEIPAAKDVKVGEFKPKRYKRIENPTVDIDSFQMSQYPLTVSQHKVFDAQPYSLYYHKNKTIREYGEINVNAAILLEFREIEFVITALNKIDSSATYRLPTGDEWEYVTRAGTTTQYYWGDRLSYDFSFRDFYNKSVYECPNETFNQRLPGYCANNFGLMHMLIGTLTTELCKKNEMPLCFVKRGRNNLYSKYDSDPYYNYLRIVRIPKK